LKSSIAQNDTEASALQKSTASSACYNSEEEPSGDFCDDED